MSSLLAKDLYNSVHTTLLSNELTDILGANHQSVKKHIESTVFRDKINKMVSEKNYSAKAVLMLCLELLQLLSNDNAPDDWINYIYQYALSKSFPQAVTVPLHSQLSSACEIYLSVLRIVCQFQMCSDDGSWQSKYPMLFLNCEEENNLENPGEYRRFLHAFKEDYIYELMVISRDALNYNILDHICGVHYLALFIARQLNDAGLPIDLGRVSGAAAGHDIGKYGCKGMELKRVPYLHYYYTDQWFKKYDINYIRHIALNHSTWDLELENLPLESLILIYADFRVKNLKTVSGSRMMHIFSLSESFDVILEKLDNVDEAKQKRYKRVYAKLRDFENYILNLGISISPIKDETRSTDKEKVINYSLMQGRDIIENIKHLSIDHNINLMYQLRDEFSLDRILQSARSKNDWKSLREYIRILEEYSTYLTQKQKIQTIRFLYELLVHPEDDIRRHSAELIGAIIAIFDEDYRKEIPENVTLNPLVMTSVELFSQYLHLFLFPGHKVVSNYREWIGYSTSIMVSSLFSHCSDSHYLDYRKVLLKYYEIETIKNKEILLYLLKTSEHIPISDNSDDLHVLYEFVLQMLKKQNNSLRLCALEASQSFIPFLSRDCKFIKELQHFMSIRCTRSKLPAENYLKFKIAKLLSLDDFIFSKLSNNCKLDKKKVSDIFLSNLKTATDWVVKKIQIEILLEYTLENPALTGLQAALHFCNLLKVSAVENVRSHAGEAILKIMPNLPIEQRNEVAIELIRALEIEGYHFAEYIPFYLGRLILWLQPVELDELIDDLEEKIKQSNPQVKSLLLKTVGICIANYPKYGSVFPESLDAYDSRLVKILGILLNALGDYNSHVKQIAFSVVGKELFSSKHLSLDQKCHIFKLIAKKILILIVDDKNNELLFLAHSAGLNHIYRFISDYNFFKGDIEIKLPKKVAFFPGTFDPFSISHKEIALAVRSMGFEVYLSIDEFSWSKRTLPNLLRRNIASMSIANELDVFLYPENFPANLVNPEDLKILKDNFPNSNVYIAVGSDVVLNASCYTVPKVENSIYTFPHIVITRDSELTEEQKVKLETVFKKIDAECIRVKLPEAYVEISSSQIRNSIDQNRDISSFVDPLAQAYIYEHGFYRREPQDKALLQSSLSIEIEAYEDISTLLMEELVTLFSDKRDSVVSKLHEFSGKPSARLIILRDALQNGRLIGFSIFHWVRSSNLYQEFKSISASEYIRKNTIGRVILIDGIFINNKYKGKSFEQILLTETLAFCLSRDYQCAIYQNMIESSPSAAVEEVLRLQGFEQLPIPDRGDSLYIVNMTNPPVLNLDVETIIKEPFRSNPEVKQAVIRSRKRLQEALTKLYPGHLVLSFDINVQHELMIKKICTENQVPTKIISPRKLGPAMCVPYGNILDKYIIPNTVTKALHTEKLYDPDMRGFAIGPFPYYLNLDIQAKTIHSFNRPVILVDDLLHKGYRIKAIDSVFKKENVQVQKTIVGILSGRGKELMDMQNREVDSVYFLPRLRMWFNENALYPFIGGDALWRGIYPERNLLPSVNFILPYTSPTFIDGASKNSIYNMSKVSIENAIDILSTLENQYHLSNGRNLTLALLGEVFITPRCPDHGRNMEYDLNYSPSHFLKNDLELLTRLEYIISRS